MAFVIVLVAEERRAEMQRAAHLAVRGPWVTRLACAARHQPPVPPPVVSSPVPPVITGGLVQVICSWHIALQVMVPIAPAPIIFVQFTSAGTGPSHCSLPSLMLLPQTG